jgi:hypothetical protein
MDRRDAGKELFRQRGGQVTPLQLTDPHPLAGQEIAQIVSRGSLFTQT